MYSFVCQKIDGKIKDDFVLSTVNAVEYSNWYAGTKQYGLSFCDMQKSVLTPKKNKIPVGSIEFVENYYKQLCQINGLSPINIPVQLMNKEFTLRNVWLGTENEVINQDTFVKSMDKIKGYTDIIKDTKNISKGRYMYSDIIDIDSEWRCFILRGELIAIHNYNNSLGLYPDIPKIKEMIAVYKDLDAYTLDVGVNEQGTFVIEVHDFYSCGLYGFSDPVKLLHMLIASHNQKMAIWGK